MERNPWKLATIGLALVGTTALGDGPLLASALARLRARHPELDRDALQRRYRIGNVIFVASDVDPSRASTCRRPSTSRARCSCTSCAATGRWASPR